MNSTSNGAARRAPRRTALALAALLATCLAGRWSFAGSDLPTLWLWQAATAGASVDLLWGAGILFAALAGASARHRALRLVSLTALPGITVVLVVRMIDGLYFYYSGDHIDLIALRHAQTEAAGLQLDGYGKLYLAIGMLLLLTTVGLCALALRAAWGPHDARERLLLLRRSALLCLGPAVPVLAAATTLAIAGDPPPAARHRAEMLRDHPERVVFRRLRQLAAMDDLSAAVRFPLDPGVRQKLRRFGIQVAAEAPWPLVKERVFEHEFPFEKSASHRSRPNVIVLFLESFSAVFTSVYNGDRFPGLTPHLEDFAAHGHVIEDFFNSSTPTMMSVCCTFCSYLPVTNTTTWDSPENGSGETRVHGLPHVLADRGWQTVHVHQLPNSFVGTGRAMHRLGFQEVHDRASLEQGLREDMASGWGYSDEQLFRYLVGWLQERRSEQPFLLSSATFDSHPPFHQVLGARTYGDGSVPLLNAIHNADHAFGNLWSWFKTSPWFENTVVVLLADHAMMPGVDNARLRPGEGITGRRYYDRTLFAIYDPLHRGFIGRSRIVSASVDVTPTILHMLGIQTRNHFEGHSVFGARTLHPRILGMNEYLFAIYQPVAGTPTLHNFGYDDIAGRYDPAGFRPGDPALNEHEFFHYFQWKKALHANNLIWPPDR